MKFNRGDLVMTDCNVTGSNYGTATKPKFPLLELWTTVLLPELEALVNVLDLQMFPAMSKRHSELLQMYSNNEANTERIWKVALQVWKSCSSSMVSRAFIHAYRIMEKIIEHDGHNHWLVDGTNY